MFTQPNGGVIDLTSSRGLASPISIGSSVVQVEGEGDDGVGVDAMSLGYSLGYNEHSDDDGSVENFDFENASDVGGLVVDDANVDVDRDLSNLAAESTRNQEYEVGYSSHTEHGLRKLQQQMIEDVASTFDYRVRRTLYIPALCVGGGTDIFVWLMRTDFGCSSIASAHAME